MKDREARISRRDFIGGAVAVAAFTIVPRHVLGGPGFVPPSEELNIACIGVGGQGGQLLGHFGGLGNIVALCDVDKEQAAESFNNYPRARKYRDFRRMLEKEDKNIDAVVVATPDHVHAVASMMAIKMGKHVFCEKPLTHSIYEARELTRAAREAGVATQMGNHGHSSEGIRLICEWVRDGAIGPVREVHVWARAPIWPQGIGRPKETPSVPATLDWDLWLGPAPKRPYHPCYVPFKWRGWWDFGTGALGDMGCHIIDPAFWALDLGYPETVEVVRQEGNNEETGPKKSIIRYEFPQRGDMPPVTMTWYDGRLMPPRPAELEPGRKMTDDDDADLLLVGDKGKLISRQAGRSPRLIPESRMREYKRPPKTLPRSIGHFKEWVEACKGGKPAVSNFDYAGPLTEIVLLGNIAIRTGQKLYWDPQKMEITNVPEANKYIRREYRDGWKM